METGPAASVSPGNTWETQVLRLHARPPEPEILVVKPSSLCVNRPSRWLQCILIFKNHWLREWENIDCSWLKELFFSEGVEKDGITWGRNSLPKSHITQKYNKYKRILKECPERRIQQTVSIWGKEISRKREKQQSRDPAEPNPPPNSGNSQEEKKWSRERVEA